VKLVHIIGIIMTCTLEMMFKVNLSMRYIWAGHVPRMGKS